MTEEEFELIWQQMQQMPAADKAAFLEELDERNRQSEAMAEMLLEGLFVPDGNETKTPYPIDTHP